MPGGFRKAFLPSKSLSDSSADLLSSATQPHSALGGSGSSISTNPLSMNGIQVPCMPNELGAPDTPISLICTLRVSWFLMATTCGWMKGGGAGLTERPRRSRVGLCKAQALAVLLWHYYKKHLCYTHYKHINRSAVKIQWRNRKAAWLVWYSIQVERLWQHEQRWWSSRIARLHVPGPHAFSSFTAGPRVNNAGNALMLKHGRYKWKWQFSETLSAIYAGRYK